MGASGYLGQAEGGGYGYTRELEVTEYGYGE